MKIINPTGNKNSWPSPFSLTSWFESINNVEGNKNEANGRVKDNNTFCNQLR